jgi:tight adherence protein C
VSTVLIAGALVGAGVYLLVRSLVPVRPGLAATLGELDAARVRASAPVGTNPARRAQLNLGASIRDAAYARGIQFTSLRQDLALLGRSLEAFLATKALLALAGFAAPLAGAALLAALGLRLGVVVPLWASLLLAAGGFFLPDVALRTEAADRRRDFRHVVGSFLDLVAMNLAGGRGVPEALMSAASISDGWAMVRIRETLTDARLHGVTPWAALGELGAQLAIDELRDLAAALALVAEDGAKVRASLAARAESMRRRDLADSEGKAQERSQSMLVAQLLLCAGFLVFLTYPAVVRVLLS